LPRVLLAARPARLRRRTVYMRYISPGAALQRLFSSGRLGNTPCASWTIATFSYILSSKLTGIFPPPEKNLGICANNAIGVDQERTP